ncbi:polyketide synthase PksD [Xylaria bambusicola]|uniref:polyketide synthase PksD n=1 Tax=Xylaria bambusicola TaxID=326684 RepID=UPI002008D28E|nr:polyketide synthase PksD [Xylaria bambusicola]KAI0509380.1 polyketide synthase PksD [Xylaria bambusicola]
MEPVAVVGLSFRLPQGAEDESSLWEMLQSRRNVMTPWPESRANIDAFYNQDSNRLNVLSSRGAHFLRDDPTAFDAPFFSITAKEAASMDPQQRWLLETSYRALENAGIPVESVAGTDTAVFSSSMAEDFMRIVAKDPDQAPMNTATGTTPCILANRLSWYFDLTGPSIQVNTACSSSMIAMDLACRSVQSGQCSMALATGSNVLLSPETSIYLSNMNFLSKDSLCYSFDQRANGYARGEGVVVLVLKRLSDAIRAGDSIRAVIRATGTNQDGHTPGITQPSFNAQEKLIRQVYASCNLGFDLTRYVEAHGTGTQIGDITETKALGRVFKKSRSVKEPLYIGSIKSNIGHLEGCSGLAGIIKCIMILERGIIPPTALLEVVNPKINAESYNIQIPKSNVQWPSNGLRRVSINSFGLGGSNGHIIMDDAFHTLELLNRNASSKTLCSSLRASVLATGDNGEMNGHHPDSYSPSHRKRPSSLLSNNVDHMNKTEVFEIEETPCQVSANSNGRCSTLRRGDLDPTSPSSAADPTTDASMKYQLLVWSARDEDALKRVHQQYEEFYNSQLRGSASCISQLAYTLAERRSRMAWRSYAIVSTDDSSGSLSLHTLRGVRSSRNTGLAFIFTGQGAQYAKMGIDLCCYPTFRAKLEEASDVFQVLGAEWSLCDVLQSGTSIDAPQLSQPICTALQIALIELLKTFNIRPQVVIGHSSGEIAAAYASGALSFESACRVAFFRGQLAERLIRSTSKPGAMMSVNIHETEVQSYLARAQVNGEIGIACVNSPFNVTLSGDERAIDTLKGYLDKESIFAQKLNTGVAYHSPAMSPIAGDYLSCLGNLTPGESPREVTLMVSSVTGLRYWVNNLVSPVRFVDALQYAVLAAPRADGMKPISHFVEIGPHSALQRSIKDTTAQTTGGRDFKYLSILRRRVLPLESVLGSVGQLFTDGYPVSIQATNCPMPQRAGLQPVANAPEYPFDHSQLYWHESRLSRNWRLRGQVPPSLLGSRVTDWNPLEPRWRKSLSIDEYPWLLDHKIGEEIFFPATGMLMIAVEAVSQSLRSRAGFNAAIDGYRVKEATFMNPITLREDLNVEAITQCRTLQRAHEKTSSNFEVQIFISSAESSDWTECFKSVIHAELTATSGQGDDGYEARATADKFFREHEHAKLISTSRIDKSKFYSFMDDQGLRYGPSFSLATDIAWDNRDTCTAHIDTSGVGLFQGVVHPGVLDACFQISATAPTQGISKPLSTMVPHIIKDAWISANRWPRKGQLGVHSVSQLKPNETGINCSITAVADDGSLLCHVQRLELLSIAGNTVDDKRQTRIHAINRRPQLSLITVDQLQNYCKVHEFSSDEGELASDYMKLKIALYATIWRDIDELRKTDWSTAPIGMKHYVSWMEMQLQEASLSQENLATLDSDNQLQELVDKRPSWKLFIEVSRSLTHLVRGEVNSDDINIPQLVQNFYEAAFDDTWQKKLASYLRLTAHQIPDQKVLELGFGPCNMTEHVLSIFQEVENETGGIAFSQYTYNDVFLSTQAPEFLARFAQFKDRFQFHSLGKKGQDITGTCGSKEYDLIIVNNVGSISNGPRALIQMLANALKPGGHLILREVVEPGSIPMNFGLGILPNWWSDDNEKSFLSHPRSLIFSEPEWDEILRENGFTGNNMVIRDRKRADTHQASIIISARVEQDSETLSATKRKMLLVVNDSDNETQRNIASNLADGVAENETTIFTISQLAEAAIGAEDIVIWLADIGNPVLSDVTPSLFRLIQDWMLRSNKILWVTGVAKVESEAVDSLSKPYHGLKDGFLRSLRAEQVNKQIVSLTLEDTSPHAIARNVEHISTIFNKAFMLQLPELEYIIQDGIISSGRLVEVAGVQNMLQDSLRPQMKTKAWSSGPPVMLSIGSRGSLETLHFNEDPDATAVLGPTEVEIDAKAWGVNFRDVFIALGRLEEADFGSDCAGVVTKVGSECTSVMPGDRVYMCSMGCMRARPRADQSAVVKIANSVSFETACGTVGPAMTAWYSLIDVGRLRKGEKVLIHAASGATGQLAIQVAQLVGAEIFATVGYDFKKQLLIEKYNIPADHIFYSRNTTFAAGIMRMTNDTGVDLVLNSLAGESLLASWNCVAPYGRFVEIGKADIYANSSLPMSGFAKNIMFAAVDLRHMMLHRKDLGRQLLLETMDLAESGKISCPDPLRIYEINEVEDAFRYIQNGKNTGRVVIRINDTVLVQKFVIDRIDLKFEENASYLIAGGLGGIGRSILKWMATRNAKYLIVPSRSGTSGSQKAEQVVASLRQSGVTIITPKCDVSSTSSLSNLLTQCSESMPPIRGCINAAMALHDSIFENMTHNQWEGTIQSKVQSSWNLHALLPHDLDFFILLSSNAGILGNMGQANYAAGCTFQDALATHRNSSPFINRKTAISLDLGVMRTIGVIAETAALQTRFGESQGHAPIEEEEFFALLEMCCSSDQSVACHSQLTVGLVTPADLLHRNLEPAEALNRPLMAHFSKSRMNIQSSHPGDSDDPTLLFNLAETAEEKVTVVVEALAKKLARALGVDPGEIDTDKPLHAFGVDSLVAVELHNWINKKFGAQVPVRDIAGDKTVKFVGELVVSASKVQK